VRRALVVSALAGGVALGQAPAPTAAPATTPAPAPVSAPAPPQRTPPPAQSVGVDAGGFTSASSSIPAVQDPVQLAPAPVPYVNPLYRPAETPARSLDHPNPDDLETRTSLLVAVRLPQNGKLAEAIPVEPPLAALGPTVGTVAPRWSFSPAKKAGAPVSTWATYGIDLQVSLEKGVFTSFNLAPVGKEDPLPELAPESAGESWITRYPKEPEPADGTVSIEDVDVLPTPEKTPWSFSSVKTSSHVTALVEVSANGAVTRIAPTGKTIEPLVVAWLRRSASKWHVSPAVSGGKPIASWMALDATLEYTVDSAKEKGKRSVKKNLRGTPKES
jgi:hypothetical protein